MRVAVGEVADLPAELVATLGIERAFVSNSPTSTPSCSRRLDRASPEQAGARFSGSDRGIGAKDGDAELRSVRRSGFGARTGRPPGRGRPRARRGRGRPPARAPAIAAAADPAAAPLHAG